jgi:hypothetical protein
VSVLNRRRTGLSELVLGRTGLVVVVGHCDGCLVDVSREGGLGRRDLSAEGGDALKRITTNGVFTRRKTWLAASIDDTGLALDTRDDVCGFHYSMEHNTPSAAKIMVCCFMAPKEKEVTYHA